MIIPHMYKATRGFCCSRVKPPDIDADNETFHSKDTTRHTVVHEGDGIDGEVDEEEEKEEEIPV
jgi:hypothetical protein